MRTKLKVVRGRISQLLKQFLSFHRRVSHLLYTFSYILHQNHKKSKPKI